MKKFIFSLERKKITRTDFRAGMLVQIYSLTQHYVYVCTIILSQNNEHTLKNDYPVDLM